MKTMVGGQLHWQWRYFLLSSIGALSLLITALSWQFEKRRSEIFIENCQWTVTLLSFLGEGKDSQVINKCSTFNVQQLEFIIKSWASLQWYCRAILIATSCSISFCYCGKLSNSEVHAHQEIAKFEFLPVSSFRFALVFVLVIKINI